MVRLTALGGYGLWRLSSSHCVGETTHESWGGGSDDSKLKEAKMSSNSDMVDEVRTAVAASAFARHWETILSLESIISENIAL